MPEPLPEDDFFAPGHPWSAAAQHMRAVAEEQFAADAEFGSPRIKYLIDASNLLNTKQSFEAGWVGQRMSWLVISQSFLFSAFATASQRDLAILIVLKWLVPVLGLVQATATRLSIQSASRVDSELYKTRSLLDVGLRLYAPGLHKLPPLGDVRSGRLYRSRGRGALSSRVIPSSLVFAWTLILIALVAIHLYPLTFDHLVGIKPN